MTDKQATAKAKSARRKELMRQAKKGKITAKQYADAVRKLR
jgi:hypothetical protein